MCSHIKKFLCTLLVDGYTWHPTVAFKIDYRPGLAEKNACWTWVWDPGSVPQYWKDLSQTGNKAYKVMTSFYCIFRGGWNPNVHCILLLVLFLTLQSCILYLLNVVAFLFTVAKYLKKITSERNILFWLMVPEGPVCHGGKGTVALLVAGICGRPWCDHGQGEQSLKDLQPETYFLHLDLLSVISTVFLKAPTSWGLSVQIRKLEGNISLIGLLLWALKEMEPGHGDS